MNGSWKVGRFWVAEVIKWIGVGWTEGGWWVFQVGIGWPLGEGLVAGVGGGEWGWLEVKGRGGRYSYKEDWLRRASDTHGRNEGTRAMFRCTRKPLGIFGDALQLVGWKF